MYLKNKLKVKKGGKAFVNGVNILDSNPNAYKYVKKKYKMRSAYEGTKLNLFQKAGEFLNSDTGQNVISGITSLFGGIKNSKITSKNAQEAKNGFNAEQKQKKIQEINERMRNVQQYLDQERNKYLNSANGESLHIGDIVEGQWREQFRRQVQQEIENDLQNEKNQELKKINDQALTQQNENNKSIMNGLGTLFNTGISMLSKPKTTTSSNVENPPNSVFKGTSPFQNNSIFKNSDYSFNNPSFGINSVFGKY